MIIGRAEEGIAQNKGGRRGVVKAVNFDFPTGIIFAEK
jgi:hypothetical protein